MLIMHRHKPVNLNNNHEEGGNQQQQQSAVTLKHLCASGEPVAESWCCSCCTDNTWWKFKSLLTKFVSGVFSLPAAHWQHCHSLLIVDLITHTCFHFHRLSRRAAPTSQVENKNTAQLTDRSRFILFHTSG